MSFGNNGFSQELLCYCEPVQDGGSEKEKTFLAERLAWEMGERCTFNKMRTRRVGEHRTEQGTEFRSQDADERTHRPTKIIINDINKRRYIFLKVYIYSI